MNQILSTQIEKTNTQKVFFYFLFVISITIIVCLIIFISMYFICLNKKEELSYKLLNSYNIHKLYANNDSKATEEIDKNNSNGVWGIIEIPKINVYYPVFSTLTEELLKISPCKFHGNSLKESGNICIAGHNYNNSKFFSNLHLLNKNDEIYIYDNLGRKYVYTVFKTYEVNESDLSPISNYSSFSKELTLVTCNNFNHNRLIVKAFQNF